jgi:DNA-directed RNA polymerase specialized sigma24 family protein
MTKKELGQLKDLHKEIEILQRQITEAPFRTKKIFDTVKGSSLKLPYQEHIIRVSGIDLKDYEKKVERLRRKLGRRIDELMDKRDEIMDFISAIPDVEIRMILECRYIDGMSFEQVGAAVGMSERTVRRKFRKWWDGEM